MSYKELKSYQNATIVYDYTVAFCNKYMSYKTNKSYKTYTRFLAEPESAANAAICLINQTTYLLDKQIANVEQKFLGVAYVLWDV